MIQKTPGASLLEAPGVGRQRKSEPLNVQRF